MRVLLSFPLCSAVAGLLSLAVASAAEPPGYYAAAAGLSGAALRHALHGIIDQHDVVGYNATRAALESLDQDPANSANVILIYERVSWPKSQWVAVYPESWEREHCWPNSLGINSAAPAFSDLHNLRACGQPANGDRSNLYFDESTPNSAGYQQPAGSTTTLCSEDSNSWEPPLEMKGDLARAMFYMDLRYEGDSDEPDLMLTDNASLITTSASYMGRLSTLLIWHFLDPASPAERVRAEGVFDYQENRNPFVDHPEWVEAIYGDVFELRYTVQGQSLVLSWPAFLPFEMAVVETSTDLTTWSTAQLSVTNQNGWHTATVPISGPRRFYRLRLRERPG